MKEILKIENEVNNYKKNIDTIRKKKKFLVLGLGKSGRACVELLHNLNKEIFVYDKIKANLQIFIEDFNRKKIQFSTIKLNKKSLQQIDIAIFSPSVILPKRAENILKKLKIECINELELGTYFCKAPIIAITGTDGKTTTTTLINEVLSCGGHSTHMLGNIGTPITKNVLEIDKNSKVILETSSFQLDKTLHFHPHIACFLNIDIDHLDYHKNFKNYFNAKLKIFNNMNEQDFACINYDDLHLREATKQLKAQIFYVSLKEIVKGVYSKDGEVFFNDGVNEFCVFSENELQIIGKHNLMNAMFATLVGILSGVSKQNIYDTLKNFKGLKHRLEFVCKKNGITYYNDSKATNVHSCITAINAFNQPVYLICGGSDKKENFKSIFKYKNKIKFAFFYGKTAKKLEKSAKKHDFHDFFVFKNLNDVIDKVTLMAVSNDIVLFSPACASYDQYQNYEERGDHFINLVR